MMMEIPKYILTFKPSPMGLNYVIYEQSLADSGKIVHKTVQSHLDLGKALSHLSDLNDDKPIILAYSTKLMDNKSDV